jgi:hypothetical protein
LVGAVNHLKVSLQDAISMLAGNGWSRRRIARELKINRETVSVYLARAGPPKPAILPPGSEIQSELGASANPAIPPAGCAAGRRSQCVVYVEAIEAAVQKGLSAQRIIKIWSPTISFQAATIR